VAGLPGILRSREPRGGSCESYQSVATGCPEDFVRGTQRISPSCWWAINCPAGNHTVDARIPFWFGGLNISDAILMFLKITRS